MPRLAAALKGLERWWRSAWIRALTRLMRRARPPAPPDWGARPHRVLFLRHDRIGDMILSTGLLRVIVTSHPTITLDVLASPINAAVLEKDPHVRSVIVFDRTRPSGYLEAARRLRRARYDAVIDCMPTAPSLTTLLLVLASGARHRIGVAGRGNDDAFTMLVPPARDATHIVDQLGALSAAFGVEPRATDFAPRLYLTEAEEAWASATWRAQAPGVGGRRLLVNVSSGRGFRRWPDDRFVDAIRHVLKRHPDLVVIVVGAPDERLRASQIARAAGVPFVPTAMLRQALALISTADLVFTPDTGLAHAASALRKPAVVMYVKGTATQWGPYGPGAFTVSSPDGVLASLPLASVLAELDRLVRPTEVASSQADSRADSPGDSAADSAADSARTGHFVR